MKFQDRSQIEALAKFKSQGDLVTSLLPGHGQGPDGPEGDPSDPEKPPQRSQGPGLRPVGRQGKDRRPCCGTWTSSPNTAASRWAPRTPPAWPSSRRSRKDFKQVLELPHGPRNRDRLRLELLRPPPGVDPGQVQPHLRPPHRPPRGRLVRRRDGRDQVPRQDPERRPAAGSRRAASRGPRPRGSSATSTPTSRSTTRRRPRRPSTSARSTPSTGSSSAREENHSSEFESHLHSYLCGKVKARLHSRVERFAGQGPPGGPRGRDPAEEDGRGRDRPEAHRRARARRPGHARACGTPSIA